MRTGWNTAGTALDARTAVPAPGSGQDKQTNQIVTFKIDQPDLREVPFVWDFTDSGWDAPLFGEGIPLAGYKVHYRLSGRIQRDQ